MPDFTYEIEDIKLAQQGLERINWVRERMPVLRQIKQDFSRTRPFAGMRIGICLHVEAKTGVWLDALISGGAEIAITGSPGTTQDEGLPRWWQNTTSGYLPNEVKPSTSIWITRKRCYQPNPI